MRSPIRTTVAAIAAAAACFAGGAAAQGYPTRTVTLVVPFAAGGPTDVVARTIGASMSKSLGQTVVVENKLGAGGTIAANYVAEATPDGYTLFIHHNGMATATGLYRKLPFNPMTDFEHIGQVADVPMTLLARRDLPPADVKELIPYVRANKDKLNLANAGLGAVSHLCGMLPDQTTQTIPQIKAQRVKLYGVTTLQRINALPDAPTLDEQGLKGFEVIVWHGVYAPKGTPPAVIEKVNGALRGALKDPQVVAKLAELGAQVVPESKQTPAGLRDWLQAEIDKWKPVIQKAGVYAD